MSNERRLVEPTHVGEGQLVVAPAPGRKGTGVRCVVAVAAGNHARVINELHGIDRWYHLRDLRVEQEVV